MAISVMKRIEVKYLLTSGQAETFRRRLAEHMLPDEYGLTTIASLYYDTPDRRLIRASMEKPAFKEKLRLRSYGPATDGSPVFLELKRKAEGIVYKRRVQTTVPQAEAFLSGSGSLCADGQIKNEIGYFRDFYGTLVPSCLILYDRTAYAEPGSDLRLTIDERPRYRMDDLTLKGSADGLPLLPEGMSILEIKVQDAMPLWLARALSECGAVKTSFSKYGEAVRLETLKAAERIIRFTGSRKPGAA